MTWPGRTHPPVGTSDGHEDVRLGLRVNLAQFVLLAVVNFFVGGMVGTERTVTPLVGSEQYHLGAIAISAFVVVFGFIKAIINAVGGAVTARYTRKSIMVADWAHRPALRSSAGHPAGRGRSPAPAQGRSPRHLVEGLDARRSVRQH